MEGTDGHGAVEVEETIVGDICVLVPSEPLPPRVARQIEETLIRLLRDHGRLFILDLSRCEAASSPVLRTVEAVSRELDRLEGALVLCGLNDHVEETVDWAGFRATLTIEPDRRAALRRIERQRQERKGREDAARFSRIELAHSLLGTLEAPPFLALQEREGGD